MKPFEMIWLDKARSDRQRAQRRCEAWPVRNDSSIGELLAVLDTDDVREDLVLSMLDCRRRRKGLEGTR